MGTFLPARDRRGFRDWGWSYYILPMLEQNPLHQRLDRTLPWNHISQRPTIDTVLPIYRCPSSAKNFPGDCDYAGLTGSIHHTPLGQSPFKRGVLVYVDEDKWPFIPLASVVDGVSQTLCVSENHDLPSPEGRWVNGLNCVSHDLGRINSTVEGIRSPHPSGANAAFLDSAVA